MSESEPSAVDDATLTEWRARLTDVILEKGYEHRDEPFELSSGELSHDFIDGKRALAQGTDLALACRCFLEQARRAGIVFEAAGGLTMGADQFAHGIAVISGCRWFVVRKQPKGRGTNKLVEGAEIAGRSVLLLDDVVTTGGSIVKALAAVQGEGANVVGAATLVDRGDVARPFFTDRGIWYDSVLTYRDLDIAPVGATLAS